MIDKDKFRVIVFGSSRLKPESQAYQDMYRLGFELGKRHMDVVTGGGPGIMEAANKGHVDGSPGEDNQSQSIGVRIELPFREPENPNLDVVEHFEKFSKRLDEFIRISNFVVIAPGGLGTLLEFAFVWQLLQVNHVQNIPVLIYGKMWNDLLDWAKENIMEPGLADMNDLDYIHKVDSVDEILGLIDKSYQEFNS